ncbi:unnamed protein product [Prorocentrum cordatum]|uniref:Uncharacterized protein n=1 Tax=Prorocentrum cordatum TaxID=2364126 RepID=A0ABN9W2W8_9DINO|nr:unnamed protein product [Polarella glacialis]
MLPQAARAAGGGRRPSLRTAGARQTSRAAGPRAGVTLPPARRPTRRRHAPDNSTRARGEGSRMHVCRAGWAGARDERPGRRGGSRGEEEEEEQEQEEEEEEEEVEQRPWEHGRKKRSRSRAGVALPPAHGLRSAIRIGPPSRIEDRGPRIERRAAAEPPPQRLLTPAPRPCSPCAPCCSSTRSSSGTTTAPGSACSGE